MMKWTKNLFQNDKALFVLSFLVAIALWMMVIGDRNPQIESVLRSVPISNTKTEDFTDRGLKIISTSSNTANVKISGRLSEVYQVGVGDVVLTADFSGIYVPGTYEIPVVVAAQPSSVTAEIISPTSLKVQIDFIVKNKRDVEVMYTGTLPDGFELGEAKVSATSVTVEGPENKLAEITKAVAVIDLNDLTKSKSFECPLKLISADGTEVSHDTLKLSTTEVSVEQEIIMAKQIPVQVVLSGEVNLDSLGVTVSPDPATIVVKGDKEVLDKLAEIETEAFPADRIPQGGGNVMMKLIIPEGVECETQMISVAFSAR